MLKTTILRFLATHACSIGLLWTLITPAYAADARVTGHWFKQGSSYRYKFVTNFELQESVDGYIEWTLLASPTQPQKIGRQGKEYVRGSFNPQTRQLFLAGYRKDDPHEILGLDEYRLEVSQDGKHIFGVTKGNGGDWIGRFDSRTSEIGNFEQARKVAEKHERLEKARKAREERERYERACDNYYPGRVGRIEGSGWLATKDGFIVRYVNKDRRTVTIEGTSGGNTLKYGEMKELSCSTLLDYER